MLKELVVNFKRTPSAAYVDLMEYTIAMCHEKIVRRFKHQISKNCINCLSGIREFAFKEYKDTGLERQHTSDIEFMLQLVKMSQDPPYTIANQYPCLLAKAKEIAIKKNQELPWQQIVKDVPIYTSATYLEYHELSNSLLKQYESHSIELETKANQGSGPRVISEEVDKVFIVGYTLWRMTNGFSYKSYLANIEEHLLDPRKESSSSASSPTSAEGNTPAQTKPSTSSPTSADSNTPAQTDRENEEDSQDPQDPDIDETMAPVGLINDPAGLCKAYWDWVRVMVVHFDAVYIIRGFAKSAHLNDGLSFQILLTPIPTGNEHTDWRDMLLDEKIFPGAAEVNSTIVEFVEGALVAKHRKKLFEDISRDWDQRMAASSSLGTKKHHCGVMRKRLTGIAPIIDKKEEKKADSSNLSTKSTTAAQTAGDDTVAREKSAAEQTIRQTAAQETAGETNKLQIETTEDRIIKLVNDINTELDSWANIVVISGENPSSSVGTGNKKRFPKSKSKSKSKSKAQSEVVHVKAERVGPMEASISQKLNDLGEILHTDYMSYGPTVDLQPDYQRGAVHCEASLASLLDGPTRKSLMDNSGYDEAMNATQNLGHTIGVSKRCCPVCHRFLLLLSKRTNNPFVTQGFHSTITSCTLPLWSPPEVVDEMNKHFGDMLRDKLRSLMEFRNLPRRASIASQDSRRLSKASFMSDETLELPWSSKKGLGYDVMAQAESSKSASK